MPWLRDLSPQRHGRHRHICPGTSADSAQYSLSCLSNPSSLPNLPNLSNLPSLSNLSSRSSLPLLRTMVLTHIAIALFKKRCKADYIAVFCVSRASKKIKKLPVARSIKQPISNNRHKIYLGIPEGVSLTMAFIHQPTVIPVWKIPASLQATGTCVSLDFERWSILEIRPHEGSCNSIAKFLPNSAQRRSVCVSLNAAVAASDTLSPIENPRRHCHLGTFTQAS